MKFTSTVISVSDVNVSRKFYQDLFGLELYQDYGINISFTCGLSLQQEFDWLVSIPKETVMKRPHNMELAFETRDFDGFLEKLEQYPGIERLGEVIEHSWGQRVVRFYDPDGHIIEVGEDMKMVVERFLSAGMTMEEVSARMDVSIKDLTTLLDE
ncbi:MAG: glyoxalase [Lawsonibacter sp.]|nr:glyoxalase [Lawsonibacter sp.]